MQTVYFRGVQENDFLNAHKLTIKPYPMKRLYSVLLLETEAKKFSIYKPNFSRSRQGRYKHL